MTQVGDMPAAVSSGPRVLFRLDRAKLNQKASFGVSNRGGCFLNIRNFPILARSPLRFEAFQGPRPGGMELRPQLLSELQEAWTQIHSIHVAFLGIVRSPGSVSSLQSAQQSRHKSLTIWHTKLASPRTSRELGLGYISPI